MDARERSGAEGPREAETEQFPAVRDGSSRRTRHGLLIWARRRPWHAGVLTVVSGVLILVLPNQGFTVVLLPGIAGLSSFVIGAVVTSLGMFLLFSPHLHGPLGIATVVLSLASFVTTNLGGLVAGMLLGLVGGSLAFAWVPPGPGYQG
jgi:hypothetical protein